MKTLLDLQNDRRDFVVAMGWDNSKTPLEAVALIVEEMGEVLIELNDYPLMRLKLAGMLRSIKELTHELRANDFDEEKTGDELSDIILRVMDLAGDLSINIQNAVESKIAHNISNIEHHKAKGRKV